MRAAPAKEKPKTAASPRSQKPVEDPHARTIDELQTLIFDPEITPAKANALALNIDQIIFSKKFPIDEPLLAEISHTLLMVVLEDKDRCNRDVVRRLLAHKPEINKKDKSGRTALHLGCQSGQDPQEILRHVTNMEGVDINARSGGGDTPLMSAVRSGNPATVKFCCDIGCNPLILNYLNMSARDYAQTYLEGATRDKVLVILDPYIELKKQKGGQP